MTTTTMTVIMKWGDYDDGDEVIDDYDDGDDVISDYDDGDEVIGDYDDGDDDGDNDYDTK